ncbi:MAG: alanine--glyoxylate aminotransferase family protein [Patescibacteria group bacterium]
MAHTKLFLAGPTEVSGEMFAAMSKPMIGHRSKEYQTLHESVVNKLKQFIGTKQEVLIFTSSATGVMEAAVRNCVRGKILHTVCGAFSERWADISRACNKQVEVVEVPFGKAIRPELVASELASDSIGGRQAATLQLPRNDGYRFDAVTITHNETSSGVMNPLKELCGVVRSTQPDAFILVDAVSSFGGSVIHPDEWGIDALLFGTQKCFALPPGLAFAVVSPRAFERSAQMSDKGYYFDFIEMKKYADKHMTPATPAISLLYGVDAQLDRMFEEGMEGRAARHQEMAGLAQGWVARRGLPFTAEEGFRSPTVTSVTAPDGFNSDEFRKKVKEKGYALADGYGELKGKGFRIGHMGDWTIPEVQELLTVMDSVL